MQNQLQELDQKNKFQVMRYNMNDTIQTNRFKRNSMWKMQHIEI
jgi:hypothetical protein